MRSFRSRPNRFFLAVLLGISPAAWLCAGETFPSVLQAPADLTLRADTEKKVAAHAHYLTARLLEEEGKMREAAQEYLRLLRYDTSPAEVVAHAADLVLRYEGIDVAVKALEEQVRNQPDSAAARTNFLHFALEHGDKNNQLMAKASSHIEDFVARHPQNPQGYVMAVNLQLASAKTAEAPGQKDLSRIKAAGILKKASAQEVKDLSYWLSLGRIAQEVWPLADPATREVNLAEVTVFFEKALHLAQLKKDEEAQLQVADYYIFTNQFQKAMDVCQTILDGKDSLDARKRVVRLHQAMDDAPGVIQSLQELVKRFPQDVEHRKLLADIYQKQAEIEDQKNNPSAAAAHSRLAAEQYEAALQVGGGELYDYLQISRLLIAAGEPERFERFTARTIQLYPNEPSVGFFRALSLSISKKYAEAAKCFQDTEVTAQKNEPNLLNDRFYFSWAVATERSQDYEAAGKLFDKSVELTPPDGVSRAAKAMNYQGYMWLEKNQNLEKAEKLILKANEIEPNEASYVDSLGWLYFHQGKFAEALRELLRAESLMGVNLAPEDAEVIDHIAQTYEKLGQAGKAKEYYQRSLDLNSPIESIRERAEKALGVGKPKLLPAPPSDQEEERPDATKAGENKTP